MQETQQSGAAVIPPETPAVVASLPKKGALIHDAFTAFWQRLDIVGWTILYTILLVAAFVAVFFAAFSALESAADSMVTATLLGAVTVVLTLLVSVFAMMYWAAMMYAVAAPGQATFNQGMTFAWQHIWSLLWLGLLYGCIFFGAGALFVIPALIIGIYSSFTMYAFVLEEKRGLAAFVRSADLIWDNWWGVLGRIVVAALAAMAFTLLFSAFIAGIALQMPGLGGMIISESLNFAIQMASTVFGVYISFLMYKHRLPLVGERVVAPLWYTTVLKVLAWMGGVVLVVGSLALGFMLGQTDWNELSTEMETMEWEEVVTQDTELQQTMEELAGGVTGLAELYRQTQGGYAGFCEDASFTPVLDIISLTGEVVCTDDVDRYTLAFSGPGSRYYCIDSAGFTGETPKMAHGQFCQDVLLDTTPE